MTEEHRVEYGGQFEAEAEASRLLLSLGLAAIAGIFLLLLSALRSARHAAIVMINLPLPLIGFISLFGIATRNGIMLVSHIRHLREDEGVIDTREAVTQGSVNRLVPILMTALSTGLALLPVALGFGEPDSEIQAPLTLVIVARMFSSTEPNIFVVPTVC